MSEKWHDDHKKAIAEKWTQCPPVTVKVKELISGQVCMGTYGLVELEVMQLERELAEAQTEIERQTDRIMSDACIISAAALAIAERDKLIEQMREALIVADSLVTSLIDTHVDRCASVYDFDRNIIKAALSAAERTEK